MTYSGQPSDSENPKKGGLSNQILGLILKKQETIPLAVSVGKLVFGFREELLDVYRIGGLRWSNAAVSPSPRRPDTLTLRPYSQ